MSSRVLSIEISQVVTKVCEMEGKSKNPKVYKSFMVNTPEGVIVDGILHANEEYVEALKKALTVHKVRAKKVFFSISSGRIAIREVTIPYVKPGKVGEVIAAKAEEYFPVDLSEYKVSHTLLGELVDEKGTKKHKVQVLAAPLALLQGYYDFAAACGLEIQSLDYIGNSLFQAVKDTCISGTRMVAKIEEYSTLLMVVQDGHLMSMRSIGYGVNDVVQLMLGNADDEGYDSAYQYGYGEAIEDLRENIYIHGGRGSEEYGEDELTASLEPLINGIARVIDFHNPKSNGHPIERVYITGLGGSFKGMKELMQERLAIPVETICDVSGLSVPKNFNTASLGDYIACIGATMHPLDLVLPGKKEQKKAEKKAATASAGKDSSLPVLIFLGGIAIACVLAVTALLPYQEAKEENERLLKRLEELKPVEELYNIYQATQTLWLDAEAMYELTENHNDNLVAFIEELEQKMPSDIHTISMTAAADNAVMNIEIGSKEAAAKVLQEISAFESIEVVMTSGLTDEKNEDGMHLVSFSVTCTYADRQEETK